MEQETDQGLTFETYFPYSCTGDPEAASGFPGTTGRGSPVWDLGTGMVLALDPGPGPSFTVPGNPKATSGSPVYKYGTKF